MNGLHARALRSFANRLKWLFILRAAVKGATFWLFFFGVVALVIKISSPNNPAWPAFGLFGIVPAAILAAWLARNQSPGFTNVRASFDRLNACGGLIMSEEAADMADWSSHLREPTAPKIQWRGVRSLTGLAIALMFAATALLLPEQFTHLSSRRPLEIGQLTDQLQEQVQTLKQEKILDEKKADDLQKQLSEIQQDSSGNDPDKTWEALDHVKEADSQAAKQAAEESVAKTSAITDAQALAQAMQNAADTGMNPATAAQAAQELARMLTAAKLEDGLLNVSVPPGLLNDLNGLDKSQLQNLQNSLQQRKAQMGQTAADLQNAKLIDASTIDQLHNAGKNIDPDALAKYLAQCNGNFDSAAISHLLMPGKGGPGGGGPAAPMTWSDPKSEDGQKFKEHMLPPGANLSDASLVGVSRAAPKVSGDAIVAEHGALAGAQGAGGSRTRKRFYRNNVRPFRVFSIVKSNTPNT